MMTTMMVKVLVMTMDMMMTTMMVKVLVMTMDMMMTRIFSATIAVRLSHLVIIARFQDSAGCHILWGPCNSIKYAYDENNNL